MVLLDTDIMVDLLRRYQPALEWLAAMGDAPMGIPGLVAMELLQGCRNQHEQRAIERALDGYMLFWPAAADCQRALHDFQQSHLKHGLGLLVHAGLNRPMLLVFRVPSRPRRTQHGTRNQRLI